MKKLSLLFTFLIAILLSFNGDISAQEVTSAPLGAGTSSSATRGPFQRSSAPGSSSVYSRANLVYTAAELTSIGITNGAVISQINWDLGSTNVITATGDATVDIYMRNSSVTDATPGLWVDLLAGSTQVATHTFNLANNFPGVKGFLGFPLSTDFAYTGGTIEILVEWNCSNLVPADPSLPNQLFDGNGSLNWRWDNTAHNSVVYRSGSSGPPSDINGDNLKAERVNTQFVTIPAAGSMQSGCVGAGTSSSATRGPFQRSSAPGSSSVYSRANLVYTAAELADMGVANGSIFSQISWDLGSTNVITATGDATMTVYMRNSSVTDATPGLWVDLLAGSTQVGTYTFNLANNFPGVKGFVDFPLATGFAYTGGTVEVLVEWDCSNLIPADASQPNQLFSGNGSLNWRWDNTAHNSLVYRSGSSGPPSDINGDNLKSERANTCFGFTIADLDPPALPITFDDAGVDYDLAPFGMNMSAELAADPTDPANMVLSTSKLPGADCWSGVTVGGGCLNETVPFAEDMMAITVDVYSPVAGAPILLKVENCDNGGLSSEVLVNTTVANQWETLTFNFITGACPSIPDFENISYDKISIFPQFTCDPDACGNANPAAGFPITGDAFLFDNVAMAATTEPLPVAPSIPIDFGEPNTAYDLTVFGDNGVISTEIVADPADPNNTVLSITKGAGALCWGGMVVGDGGLENPIPFSASETEMRMDVYSPVVGANILLKVEGSSDHEISAVTTVANEWETLIFDFANACPAPLDPNGTYTKVVIIPQYTCNPNACGAPNIGTAALSEAAFFFDNIRMTTQPFLECRQPTSTVNTEGLCGAANLTVLDPFVLNPDNVSDFSLVNNAPAFYPVGTTTNTYTLTTAEGDSSCEQQVIIEDQELATVAPCETANGFCSANSCFASIIIDPIITDNCGVASITGVGTFTYEIGLHEHPVVVTDVNGNVTTHIIDVAIHDEIAPEFTNCPTEQVVLASSTYPASLIPSASDNCGIDEITNSIPEGGLPSGASQVTFTAEDTYGNLTDCVVDVMVMGDEISLHPASDIGATLAEDENSQIVTWNPLNATTQCSYCDETNLEGFTFVGNYWGHQYFLADEVSLTRQDAQLMAEGYDAHLAVISTSGENNYLKEALSNEVRTAWIGLMPQNVNDTWSFVWDNEEANAFDALVLDMNEVNANTRIVLSQDGNWVAATDSEEKYFLIERPCVDFTQVGPYAPSTSQLLRSGDAWPEGEYEVTYAAVDMCGNESQLSFDVNVQPEVSEFCTTAGTDNSVWIEGVTFHDMTSTSSSNEGYADFSEEVTTMNIGDGVVLLDLTAGGNTTDEVLYWRVWLDRNNDGDFFDADEVLFSQSTENAHLQANIALTQEAVSNARLRVAVARHAFPAPCGNPYVGEVEDYTVTLTVPTVIDIEREAQVHVFPNPADTYVNVDLSDFAGEEVSIRVINNLGKSVSFTKEIVAIKGNVRLDLRGITGGMYNISVSTSERQITKRFVISNVRRMTTAR